MDELARIATRKMSALTIIFGAAGLVIGWIKILLRRGRRPFTPRVSVPEGD
jgi:hypothetical protein